jgi:signal transduction histidine kinase
MFQEILSNITKHAKATQIELGIQRLDGRVQFSVSDNGIGFNVNQTLASSFKERGMGLGYMEEQARMLGGALNIRSKGGKGTRINITVPF